MSDQGNTKSSGRERLAILWEILRPHTRRDVVEMCAWSVITIIWLISAVVDFNNGDADHGLAYLTLAAMNALCFLLYKCLVDATKVVDDLTKDLEQTCDLCEKLLKVARQQGATVTYEPYNPSQN